MINDFISEIRRGRLVGAAHAASADRSEILNGIIPAFNNKWAVRSSFGIIDNGLNEDGFIQ